MPPSIVVREHSSLTGFTIKHIICGFLLFSLFIPEECLSARADKNFVVGLSKSGVKKILKKTGLKSFQHPVSLENKEIYKILSSLYYSNYMRDVLLWELRKTPLFTPKKMKKLTPLLRNSLKKANSKQMVYFSKGKGKDKTEGNAFYANSKLYFHFKTVKGKTQEWKGTGGKPHDQWKLVPQEGQSYLKRKGFLGLEDTFTDWLIVDISTKKQTSEKQESMHDEGEKSEYYEIEKRLKFLKKMRNKGLITEEDYEKKKEKLLDTL